MSHKKSGRTTLISPHRAHNFPTCAVSLLSMLEGLPGVDYVKTGGYIPSSPPRRNGNSEIKYHWYDEGTRTMKVCFFAGEFRGDLFIVHYPQGKRSFFEAIFPLLKS